MRFEARHLARDQIRLPRALRHVAKVVVALDARDEAEAARIPPLSRGIYPFRSGTYPISRQHGLPSLPQGRDYSAAATDGSTAACSVCATVARRLVDQPVDCVGKDAWPSQLKRARRLGCQLGVGQLGGVGVGIKFGDDPLECRQHERVACRRDHDAVPPLRQPHQVGEARAECKERDEAGERARQHLEERERFREDDGLRAAGERRHWRKGVDVNVGVDAPVEPQDRVAPYIAPLHARCESIVYTQHVATPERLRKPLNVFSRLRVICCHYIEADSAPRLAPSLLLRRQAETTNSLM
mmetsp:Transcript_33188/g.63950  ORF Transcript_33188/g.63950 Transcript_33188/m.63950 type:complete len:298 (-) Transcript_33188:679-1572(-)